jgi:hypothetical protein
LFFLILSKFILSYKNSWIINFLRNKLFFSKKKETRINNIMTTTTTSIPRNKKARFYIMLDADASNSSMFTRGEEPITFTLSAGSKFPTDLSILMNKTKRFISLTSSMIEGVSDPQCIGENCECFFCVPDGCMNKNCLEKTSTTSSAYVQCNQESCARTNDMKYFVSPLYPAKELYLSEYNPKFRFLKFIPSQTIGKNQIDEIRNQYLGEEENQSDQRRAITAINNQMFETPAGWSLPPGMTVPPGDFIPYVGTVPPGDTPPPGWRVLPGMVIPPGGTFPPDFMSQFGEPPEERTGQTPPPLMPPGLSPPPQMPPEGETRLNLAAEENSDMIQLPEFVVFSITYPSMYDFNTGDKFSELYQSLLPFNLGFLYFKEDKFLQHNIAVLQQILRVNKLPKTLLDTKKINMKGKITISSSSVESDEVVTERFDATELKNLVVPTSSQEDTDTVVDVLLTPEPDNYVDEIENIIVSNIIPDTTSTAPPKTTKPRSKKKGLSTGAKIGMGLGASVVVLLMLYGLYKYWKKQNKKKNQ